MDKTPHFSQEHLKLLENTFKNAGLKLTQQRIEIFQEVMTFNGHPTAENIYKNLSARMPSLSIDTVYRTLSTLAEIGLIEKIQGLDNHTIFDTNLTKHHHFVCTKCKRIDDFQLNNLDNITLPTELVNSLGIVQTTRIELRGVCKNCLEESSKN